MILFFIHILVLVIKAFGKNEVINQSVTMLGGRMIGESDSGFVPLLTPISESTDTIVKGVALPVASVTSAFAGLYVSICQMNTGQIFDVYLENQLVIGRTGGSAYIQLNDNKVSAKHCMLYRKGEQILIQDLNFIQEKILRILFRYICRMMSIRFTSIIPAGRHLSV